MDSALVICTPGLEKECLRELREVWPYLLGPDARPHLETFPEVEFLRGGLEVPCSFFIAVQLNFFLKMATRILWRVHKFRSRDFPKLYQSLKKVDWRSWLAENQITWHISAAGSRLNNEKRILEVAEKVLSENKIHREGAPPVGIYIRNFKDELTVSFDLSGEPLYKRNLSKKTGEAPFRETWAHFVLRRMLSETPLNQASQIQLVDPFMGSGTFLLEAATYQQPSFERAFAFQNLLRAPKLFKSKSFSHNYKWPQFPVFKGLWGSDLDPQMLSLAQENFTKASIRQEIPLNLTTQDALKPHEVPPQPLWLVSNPPWGARLPQDIDFPTLCEKLLNQWRPLKMALVLPFQSLKKSEISKNYELKECLSLVLGGQDVDLLILTQK